LCCLISFGKIKGQYQFSKLYVACALAVQLCFFSLIEKMDIQWARELKGWNDSGVQG